MNPIERKQLLDRFDRAHTYLRYFTSDRTDEHKHALYEFLAGTDYRTHSLVLKLIACDTEIFRLKPHSAVQSLN